jgi:hypothetical protein
MDRGHPHDRADERFILHAGSYEKILKSLKFNNRLGPLRIRRQESMDRRKGVASGGATPLKV